MTTTLENPVPAELRIPDPVLTCYGQKDSFEDTERGSLSQSSFVPSIIDDEQIRENDPFLVDFDGPDDPANPLNWSRRYKWAIVILLSSVNLIALVLSMYWKPRLQMTD